MSFHHITLSALQAEHIAELLRKHKISADPPQELVATILAETGGVARLVACAISYLQKFPPATPARLDPNRFLDYVSSTTPKDLQPKDACDDLVLEHISEWALLELPLLWSGLVKDSISATSTVHEKIAAAGVTKVHELVNRFGFHTTPHEYFADSKVRLKRN